MANIAINSVPTRVQYTASGGQTVFSYTFPIKANTDLKVYLRAGADDPDDVTDLLTLTTDYTVTGANTANGGTVVLVVAATVGDIVTIVGDKPIDRTAIYEQSVTLKKADLNNDFNNTVMYEKQTETIINELTPKYQRSELISPSVRADKLKLPMLNDRQTWVGRGNFGDSPDDIIAADAFPEELLEVDFILGTADANLPNAQVLGSLGSGFLANSDGGATGTLVSRSFSPTANQTTLTNGTGGGNVVVGLADNLTLPGTEGFLFPMGTTAERPGAPDEGRTRYNLTSGQWEGYNGLAWVNFVDTGGTVVSASYVTLSDESGSLPSSFSLGDLSTGLVFNTVVGGVSTLSEAVDGTDYLSPATGALRALSNLSATAINTDLVSDSDGVDNLGSESNRWFNLYAERITTGQSAADALNIGAWDVNGAVFVPFITLTANDTPTCLLQDGVEAVTQAPNDSSDLVATTEYVDLAVAGGGGAFLPLAGGTMLGDLILNADPTNALGAVTKQYVDAIAAGIDIKDPAYAATTGALTALYANGVAGVGATLTNTAALAAFSVDGVSPPLNSRILVKNQGTTFQNGIYTLTVVGSGAVAWVLTRATDYDQSSEISTGDLVIVENGTANAVTSWLQTATVATIGTDAITFVQFSGAASGANTALSNLAAVAINTALLSAATNTIDIGSAANLWKDIYATRVLATTIELGAGASDTTLSRASAGDVNIEGNIIYRAGGTDVPLLDGGTNASLVASNGGIFYSTATAGAILAGTATARQMLQSGASATPAWSTATYPATTTVNRILYSSATNTISEITTANSGVLITSGAGVPSISTAIPNGVTATTQSASDNSTKIATTAYADAVGAAGGSLTLIASVTAAASATVNFSNNLSATYDNYLIVMERVVPATNGTNLQMQIGTGAGPTYQTTNYSGTYFYQTTTTGGGGTVSTSHILSFPGRHGNSTLNGGGGYLYLHNANDATNYKPVSGQFTYYDSTNTTMQGVSSFSTWQGATVLTSLRFSMAAGNITTGIFKLYGIKN